MKKRTVGIAFLLLSIVIMSVSAYVYEQASQTTTQTIINVASLTLNSAVLGNIEEGQTIVYTAANTSALNDILTATAGKANLYLHFNTNLDTQSSFYDTYTIEVIVSSKPSLSGLTGTVATYTIASPDAAVITLDAIGTYVFDFQITTTAKIVSADQAGTVTITVTAEST